MYTKYSADRYSFIISLHIVLIIAHMPFVYVQPMQWYKSVEISDCEFSQTAILFCTAPDMCNVFQFEISFVKDGVFSKDFARMHRHLHTCIHIKLAHT